MIIRCYSSLFSAKKLNNKKQSLLIGTLNTQSLIQYNENLQ